MWSHWCATLSSPWTVLVWNGGRGGRVLGEGPEYLQDVEVDSILTTDCENGDASQRM